MDAVSGPVAVAEAMRDVFVFVCGFLCAFLQGQFQECATLTTKLHYHEAAGARARGRHALAVRGGLAACGAWPDPFARPPQWTRRTTHWVRP
jgi:hypothetical protein